MCEGTIDVWQGNYNAEGHVAMGCGKHWHISVSTLHALLN
jgi:hypothetical protein